MHLKGIELHGFKSFADRVVIEFRPGINAIVGPNGSGKSNIIDAIRWVLGEQSIKTLRGYKLEDVIFAGSNKKRSMGMAEVAITIDNLDKLIPLDYSEICFMRRTFRSGESEFFLNRTPCRLKDIQEILVDSGIGKDGYSIISQGQIDQILTCKAEERRAIFEETAGIMKYQNRKREAEKKLEETMHNMDRLDDLITELSSQIKPLAIQKDIAIKHKRLTSTYKEMDISLHLLKLEAKEKKLMHIKNNLQEAETILVKLDTTIESQKNQLDYFRKKQNTNEKNLEKAQSDFYYIDSEIKNMEKDLQWATAERERILTENKNLLGDIEKKQVGLVEAKGSLNLKRNDLEKGVQAINQLESNITKNEKRLCALNNEIRKKQRIIESIKSVAVGLMTHESEKRNAISNLNTMRQNLEKRLRQIQAEGLQLYKSNELTSRDIDSIKDEIVGLDSLYAKQKQNIEGLRKILNQKTVELKNVKKVKMQKQQNLTMVTSRVRILKELVNGYEGYQFGAKNLLIALNDRQYNDPEIYGSVAELISVKHGYEVAIETALGGAMQNIICRNEENAKNAINFLNRKKYGRATFLPLSTIKPRFIEATELKLLSANNEILVAIDLVTFNKKYYTVFAYLLGRVLVSHSLDEAINLAKQCKFKYKIVTIKGEVLNPGGSITGGSQRKSNFLLSRKRELEENEKKIDELSIQFNEKRQLSLKLKDEIQTKQKTLEEGINDLHTIDSKMAVLKKQLQEKQNIFKERLFKQKQLDKEELEVESEISNTCSQISQIESEINGMDIQSVDNMTKTKDLQKQLESIKETRDKTTQQITELKIKLATFKHKETNINENLQSARENIDFIVKEINDLNRKIEDNNNLIVDIDKKILDYKENIKKLSVKRQEHKNTVRISRQRKDDIRSSIDKVQKKLNELERECSQKKGLIHEGNIKKATVNLEINQIKNQIYEKYSLTVAQALKLKKQSGSAIEMQKDLIKLKKRIEALGPVNMQAIKDYNSLKARRDFLKSQLDDLIKAKLNLDHLIGDIINTMEKMLLASIETINKEFGEVFSKLFEGGKAQLIIEGGDSILESGVQIHAQPPGKKLQSLSLLSGGESALTAIALLFAILNTKVTPFCVLDEIDATLDDINITRFAKYLKKMSKHTQFIIITHRRQTMEVADALYGISMGDKAISEILTVEMV